MRSEGPLSTSLELLMAQEVERALNALKRHNQQALLDNPEGAELVAAALRDSMWLGVAAGCELESFSVGDLDSDRQSAWEDWWQMREQTPEAQLWPAFLAESAPGVLDRADELLASVATELNLRGRTARNLRHAGAQAAEAGAALSHALSRKPATRTPQEAVLGSLGDVQPDGIVRVATAANQAEAELLQGALQTAGIPSTWRRTGADLPGLLAAGYREIYVLEDAATEARAILATSAVPGPRDGSERAEQPTRKVGLERTTLRLIGKAAATLVVLSLLWEAATGLQLGWAPALVLAAVLVAAIAAIIGWRSSAA